MKDVKLNVLLFAKTSAELSTIDLFTVKILLTPVLRVCYNKPSMWSRSSRAHVCVAAHTQILRPLTLKRRIIAVVIDDDECLFKDH